MVESAPYYRSWRDGDLPDVVDVFNVSIAADGVPQRLELAELREELQVENVDLASDTLGAFVGDRLVGFAYVAFEPSTTRLQRCVIFGKVRPEYRRHGIGSALLAWAVPRGRARLLSHPSDLPKVLRVETPDHLPDADRLFVRHGFTATRWFLELARPLRDLPEPAVPVGFRIADWPEDDDSTRLVRNEAFEDHWGSVPASAAAWSQQTRGHGARPDLSAVLVTEATNTAAAICLNHRYPADDEVTGTKDGWISIVATRREYRGFGLATALISHALHRFAAAGLTRACIEVDSQNPTGAADLYRRLGFIEVRRSVAYQQQVELPTAQQQ